MLVVIVCDCEVDCELVVTYTDLLTRKSGKLGQVALLWPSQYKLCVAVVVV